MDRTTLKKIFTSYYSKSGNHPLAVSISLSSPSFFRREWFPKLAPSPQILFQYKAGKINEDEYTLMYLALLKERNLTPQGVIDKLRDGSVLVCYERPEKFCHRQIVAEWIEHGTGIHVPEIVDPKPPSLVDDLLGF